MQDMEITIPDESAAPAYATLTVVSNEWKIRV